MNINRHRRSVHNLYIKILCNELVQEGVAIEDLLKAAHLPLSFMDEGEGMVSIYEFHCFVDFALSRTGKKWLGLALGAKLVSNHHGPLGYLMTTSPDLGTAIEALVKYVSLRTHLLTLELCKGDDEVRLVLHEVEKIDAVQQVFIEAFLITTLDVLQLVFGRPIEKLRLELAYNEPEYVDFYRNYIDCPIQFGCKANAIVLPASALGAKNIMADSKAFALAEIECRNLFDRTLHHQNLKSRIEKILLDPSNPFPTLDVVAEQVGMSKSTLIRKLAKENTSFKQVINSIRHELASYYLIETDISVERIAEKLGYEDSSNFARVFLRWTNTTPSRFRLSHRAKGEKQASC